jgi:hypothetical protein
MAPSPIVLLVAMFLVQMEVEEPEAEKRDEWHDHPAWKLKKWAGHVRCPGRAGPQGTACC